MRTVTCAAPVNIAVIKYWGKRDERLILPVNDSISFTLSLDEMYSKTTVSISPTFTEDKFWLNGKEESLENPRIQNCLKEIRRRASKRKLEGSDEDVLNWHVHICSANNFPTAAGLASSAAGYACLVYALGQVYGVEGDLSSIARQGSGSACRSVHGGLVRWYKGEMEDGTDSFARPIAPANHFPNLRVIICVANDGRKKTGSTEGMRRTVQTSRLMQYRIRESVGLRIDSMMQAIKEKNWSAFCDLTIADSNEMHAVCQDSFPPCIYMSDTSHAVASLVHQYNEIQISKGNLNNKVCYTFDAGPNACLFVPGAVANEMLSLLLRTFPPSSPPNADNFIRGMKPQTLSLSKELESIADENAQSGRLKYLIHTKVGEGPRVLTEDGAHLLDPVSGLPTESGGMA
ncbi:diphosphomevalonate decarboxylase [Penaeus vannamei]|uniref:Diphosphomevalonate decarboxylase n=1 Tax=Penaeus vannamei TaxID=6689 RepID=A0A423U5P4_PENVA|nr:diphosphomevalonate decarboxylase-like [Penaeus vannamei]ROT84009.1 putative diphosphomevalonate decarboxylase [Penaeus vannamei]